MATAEVWLIIFAGMILTYATRLSFTVLIPPDRLPPSFSLGLAYIPPAVLAAIVLPELLFVDGQLSLSPSNSQLVAGALAGFVAWRFKNTWLAIVTGMLALWLLLRI